MSRKINSTLLIYTLLVLASAVAPAETIVLGEDDGWSRLASRNGVEIVPGRGGYHDVRLTPRAGRHAGAIDLHLTLDELPLATDNYEIGMQNVQLVSHQRAAGGASAWFAGPSSTIELGPRSSAMFTPERDWNDFSIAFFLYPVTLSEGEVLLTWAATLGRDDGWAKQSLQIRIEQRRLHFHFENFFRVPVGGPLDVELSGRTGLIPRTWSYHVLRFSADSGLLEYSVDGRPESITHVTRSGREDGTVYRPRIGSVPHGPLQLGGGYNGLIDDLRISDSLVSNSVPISYPSAGEVVSEVFDLGSSGAMVNSMRIEAVEPDASDVYVYLRVADRRDGRDSLPAPWTRISTGDLSVPLVGRFVQVRADLLPGYGGEVGPILSSIEIDVTMDELPRPPSNVEAVGSDRSVELSWSAVPESDVLGYLVYYGDQPGLYFGSAGARGASPIDVGPATSIDLEGLENGTLYYFAVAAYDASGITRHLALSREVTARPTGSFR